jgi:hypothetical protein
VTSSTPPDPPPRRVNDPFARELTPAR